MSLRPGGVTGIAVLALIAGIGLLALGLVITIATDFAMAFYFDNIDPIIAGLPLIGSFYSDNLAGYFLNPTLWLIAGIVFIAIGALLVLTCFGLLNLKTWGYWLAIIISIPFCIVIIGIIIIWYLRKDEVKAAFGIA